MRTTAVTSSRSDVKFKLKCRLTRPNSIIEAKKVYIQPSFEVSVAFLRSISIYFKWKYCPYGDSNVEKIKIMASAWDFQKYGILTCVDSDEPLQPTFKIRHSKWCSVSSLSIIEYSSDKQRHWSDCAYAQVDLRLCWSHIPHCLKSHALAQIQ